MHSIKLIAENKITPSANFPFFFIFALISVRIRFFKANYIAIVELYVVFFVEDFSFLFCRHLLTVLVLLETV